MGVLRRAVRAMPGTATWVTAVAMWAVAPPELSTMGTLFVALGINLSSFQAQSILLKHKFMITYAVCCFNNKIVYPF